MNASWLEDLSYEECLALLRDHKVGRIAIVVDEFPLVLPVNYRVVEATRPWLALRTRPGNVIDRASMKVAFQIDDVDMLKHRGWSVLVRGTMHRVDPEAADFARRFDPEPWLTDDRDAWLVIDPFLITGRRLHSNREWAFNADAYL